ncbi:15621_t:CDS:2, partial [Dentiscutata heterogama]
IEQKVIEICKKIFQDELRNILNKFKTLLSSYNLSPELASSMALDEPIDINLVHCPANDLTTAECRINNILLPKAVLDGALTRDTDYTMIHDIIVSDYDKYALIIGTDWLDLAG